MLAAGTHSTIWFQMDEKLIDQFIADKVEEITKDVDTDVDLAYKALEQLWKIMAFNNNGTTSRLLDFFKFCASVEPSASNKAYVSLSPTEIQHEESGSILSESTLLPSTDVSGTVKSTSQFITPSLIPELPANRANITSHVSDGLENTTKSISIDSTKAMSPFMDTLESSQEQSELSPWLENFSPDQCDESSKYIDKLALIFTADIQKDQKFFITLQKYQDSDWTDEFGKVKYLECFDLIDQGKKILESFFAVKDLIDELPGSGFHEGSVIMEKLMDHHQDFHISDSSEDFDSRLESACSWRAEFAELVRQNAETDKADIVKLQGEGHEAKDFLKHWYFRVDEVVNIISTDNLERYLSKDITKQELAQQWLSPENVNRRRKFLEIITDLEYKRLHYDDVLRSIVNLMVDSYGYLRYGRWPIINNSSVHDLELMKKALTVKLIRDHVTEGDIIDLIIIDKFPEVFREGPIKVDDTTVRKPLQDMRQELEVFEMNLREYEKSIKMESQFYL